MSHSCVYQIGVGSVDGNYVLTEKKTSIGNYRVETQHILPAPLLPKLYDRLIEAGKIVSEISGSQNGAVHNELFLNRKTGDVYCVEPNRRPAGLKLWDWIGIAYPGIDNWKAWLNWATGKKNTKILFENQYYVGCRMLQSSVSGNVININHEIRDNLLKQKNICDITITKKIGQEITDTLRDNSHFIGYVVSKEKTENELRTTLDRIEKEAANIFTIR